MNEPRVVEMLPRPADDADSPVRLAWVAYQAVVRLWANDRQEDTEELREAALRCLINRSPKV